MVNVLVLCTGNSCRSQMMQGYLNALQGDNAVAAVYSAGIEAHGLNPGAVSIMAEDKVDISHHTSKNVTEYKGMEWDYIITVCDHAKETCPYIPSKNAKRVHQNFFDPSKVEGTDEEKHAAFLKTRCAIREFAEKFIAEELTSTPASA